MAAQIVYGRNRQSVADIDQELHDIFSVHPQSYTNKDGEVALEAQYLPDVFATYREEYGIELMTPDEMNGFSNIINTQPALEATPGTILALVAMRTSNSPTENADEDSPEGEEFRGRSDERDYSGYNSRSSSMDSNGTSVYRLSGSRPPSRPQSRNGPRTPAKDSVFDVQKRQRTTPLGKTAPSSWSKRPVAPSRRKSDAGGHSRALSDSESSTAPTAYNRSAGRPRRTSNSSASSSQSHLPQPPLSPTTSVGTIGSPTLVSPQSRPHSRTQSQPQAHFNSMNFPHPYGPSGRESPSDMGPPYADPANPMYDGLEEDINSLPMPRSLDFESEDDDDDSALGLILDHERSAASSTVSMEPTERMEALQRVNAELGKKLMEAERTLQNRLADHEMELEEMEARLEEAKGELSAAKREEKELRNKEKSHITQISVLEVEIAKVQKSLETSRASYESLQKQYKEQLSQSEDLRNTLRLKDLEIKDHQEVAALQLIEINKWSKEHDAYEDRIGILEGELAMAHQAQSSLDEQKQENLMLKETIDRMRFDMDELRNGLSSSTNGSQSGGSSAVNSMSKSLGAELLSHMGKGRWDEDEDDDKSSNSTLEAHELESQDEETESEDVIQTIITRTTRRGPNRANKVQAITIEDNRVYADAYTQYDASQFTSSSSMQTDPQRVSTSGTQTEPPKTMSFSIQTDPALPKATTEVEIQTDEPEPSRSPSPTEADESMTSSSSTVLPPTPKAKAATLDPLQADLPPSYNQAASQALLHDLDHLLNADDLTFANISDPQARRDLRIAAETLKKWHKGAHLPVRGLDGGVSPEAIAEWRALKQELGIDCTIIDKIIAASPRTESTRPSRDGSSRRNRFYNIYNTYVYGARGEGKAGISSLASHLLLCVGASAAVFIAMSPFLAQQYVVPGGPTYYDRAAWTSFNTMHATGEGFANDGTAAVWHFLGRLGGGAAHIVRGFPT